MRVLVVNAGSATLKVALVAVEPGGDPFHARHLAGTQAPGGGRGEALARAVERIGRRSEDDVPGAGPPEAVAHRVVHGGDRTEPAIVDDEVVAAVEAAAELAPLHNRPALDMLAEARATLPGLPHVAVFDTAFFAPLPDVARAYALPPDMVEGYGLYRYGFHGLAHRWMAARLADLAPGCERVVTLQLGSGCSAAAVVAGRPVDTSMGLTPLEGLVMRTRSGDVDPALPVVLARRAGLGLDEVERLLSERSGLAGMTGTGGDVREVLELAASGDGAARLAVDLFCHRVRKTVGAYAAVMGGLDAVTFGGGVGEHQPDVRARCLAGLGFLGVELDPVANEAAVGEEARISSGGSGGSGGSGVEVWVVPVDEAAVAASDAATLLTP